MVVYQWVSWKKELKISIIGGRFLTDAKTLDESFDFSNGKHFFIVSLLAGNY